MFIVAVFSAVSAAVLLTWAVATRGRLLHYQSGAETLKENFRWWHLAIALCLLVLVPWGISTGMASAGKASVVGGYQQFLNGALVSANVNVTGCYKDGPCVHEYDCDPYDVKVLDQEAYTDDKGVYHSEVSHYETRYHDCPEVTKEYTYTVTGTFGFKNIDYTIASHLFALHPAVWRSGEGARVESGVPRGVPPDWRRYKWDLDHHDADPITAVDKYVNFVLASKDTILKAYSDEVDTFLKQGILPEHTAGFLKGHPIRNRLEAYKMSFVGFKPDNARQWQNRLMHFNAALGMQLQGDMHIVAIDDRIIGAGRSEAYVNALKAYWQGPKMGKKALAKNGIIVALGVNPVSQTITWARAQTGMPVGNGTMLAAIESRLPDKPFDPKVVLGNIRAMPYVDKGKTLVKYSLGYGALAKIVFHDFPFARACMQCKDKSDKGTSFVYLKADIQVPFTERCLNVFFSIMAGALCVGIFYLSSPAFVQYQSRPGYGRY